MTAKKKKKRSARRGAPNVKNKNNASVAASVYAEEAESGEGDREEALPELEDELQATTVAEWEEEIGLPEPPEAERFFIGEPEPCRRRASRRSSDGEELPLAAALADRIALIVASVLLCAAGILALCVASGARVDRVTVGESDQAILFWSEITGGYEGRLFFTERGRVDVTLKGVRVTLKYSNGDRYIGEATDFLPNGSGEMSYADGTSVKGYFSNGLPHGLALCILPSGERYEGDFALGVKSGQGKLTFADGGVYIGEFSDGRITGEGEMRYASGDVCVGEWLDGKPQGRTRYFYASGDVYDGEWLDGYAHGVGTMYFANGDLYEGEFVRGAICGNGKYTWSNGDVYEGVFPGK